MYNLITMKENVILFSVLKILTLISGEYTLEKVADPVLHGEGPHWDAEKQVLYYVDISNQTVCKFDPKTQTVNQVHVDGGPVSFVIPDKLDETRFVIGLGRNIATIKWNGWTSSEPSDLKVLSSVDPTKPKNRFNDGKVDSSGRLWAGTMGPEDPDLHPYEGSFYSFDPSDEFKPRKHLSRVSVSNGMAWNDENDVMYYVDSFTRVISVFDFDMAAGRIDNRSVLFDLKENNIVGFPDGMAIDRMGNLWVAVFNGGCILHIDTKERKLIGKIDFPVKQVTSCAFGGEDLQDLYVTTSRVNIGEEELKKQPLAGALFKISALNVSGQIKENKFRLNSQQEKNSKLLN